MVDVTAILVTRGNVDMQPVIDSIPKEWEVLIWDNGERMIHRSDGWAETCRDLKVWGRYAGIQFTRGNVIYFQDDDVIVSDPQAIVDRLVQQVASPPPFPGIESYDSHEILTDALAANMPQEFRHEGYTDSCLVGFGAAFYRGLADTVFDRWLAWSNGTAELIEGEEFFHRTCDVLFTTLVPERLLVDVPKENREFAEGPDRMYRQPDHLGERARMLELARKVRDS